MLDNILGQDLSSHNRFMILDTCGLDTSLPRFSEERSIVQLVGIGFSLNNNISTHPTGEGLDVYWGSTLVSAAGGEYRLCWCGSSDFGNASFSTFSCSTQEAFRLDIGELVLIGVSPLMQDRTCVSGQTCLLDGILGKDLSAGDRFLVLHTCGTNSILERFMAVGLMSVSQVSNITTSGSTALWVDAPITAAGGQYRLCWCHAGFSCSISDHFVVDTGELTLIGVSPLQQDRTCIAGQTCALDGIVGVQAQ
jgi:hypothetical protein